MVRFHVRRGVRGAVAGCAIAASVILADAKSANAQHGFSAPLILNTLVQPTGLVFAPDGRLFVSEVSGRVRIVENGVVLPTPFINLQTEVLAYSHLGLIGIALDPDFANNRYVYLLYTVKTCGNNCVYSFGRLVRYTGTEESNGSIADPKSRLVLIGETHQDGIPICSSSHTVGSLRWANDGTLFVSAGDGATFAGIDVGGMQPPCFAAGKNDPIEDVGAFRSQFLGSLAGKILRIDPATGLGLPDNPYYTGNPADKQSKVWAYGLRNAFRFAVKPGSPGPGTLYIGDVGWLTWEELNISYGGENFGWPCYEGMHVQAQYFNATPQHSGCNSIGGSSNPAYPKQPIVVWNRTDAAMSTPPGLRGQCALGGLFYQGSTFPVQYRGAFIFGDFSHGWVKALRTNDRDELVDVLDIPMGTPYWITDMTAHPETGEIYFLYSFGALRYIKYTPKPGDLNIDMVVDVLDLITLLAAWGPCPKDGTCPADIDSNGSVDVVDLLTLLANWG